VLQCEEVELPQWRRTVYVDTLALQQSISRRGGYVQKMGQMKVYLGGNGESTLYSLEGL